MNRPKSCNTKSMKITLTETRLLLLAIDTHLNEMSCVTEQYVYSDGTVAKLSTHDKQNLAEIKAFEKLRRKLVGRREGTATK